MTGTTGLESRVALVSGVGPGLGAALARRLADAGYKVSGLARSESLGRPLQEEMEAAGRSYRHVACDVTDAAAVASAVHRVVMLDGPVRVLVHNAAGFLMAPFAESPPDAFERLWRVNCLGGMILAQAVLPHMLEAGGGAILFTGATAALRGGARFAAFASSKFAQRGLAQSLAREYGPQGIHVAHVVVDGVIRSERARDVMGMDDADCLDPDAIAETYLQIIGQHPSAWTHEVDLRPFKERF